MQPTDATRPLNIVRADANNMNFVKYPFELGIFNSYQAQLTELITSKLEDSSYRFSPSALAEVPKGKGAVRPGSILTLDDQLAYSLLVESSLPYIRNEIGILQGVSDFGYQLYPDTIADHWFKNSFNCWNAWKEDSLKRIDDGAQFVVVTDITGCYENIDIKTLMLDLTRIGVPQPTISLLRKGLKSWSQIDTKGIPQGVSSSHMLAKLYLSQIDVDMRNHGYKMTRYVDDIKIFCSSIAESRKALILLTNILRKRGLNMQSSKSKILKASEAVPDIRGQAAVIDFLQSRLIDELDPSELDDNPYAAQIAVNTTVPNASQIALLREAFNDYFVVADDSSFDKSLYHYLLNKLGSAGDDFAADYSTDLLDKHPEETPYILGYLGRIVSPLFFFNTLINYCLSSNSVYDYQNFLICEWLLSKGCDSHNFLSLARSFAFDNNKPAYYRSLGKQIITKIGQHSDHLEVKESFVHATTIQEKGAIICSLSSLTTAIRNGFYSELDESVSAAISYARQLEA